MWVCSKALASLWACLSEPATGLEKENPSVVDGKEKKVTKEGKGVKNGRLQEITAGSDPHAGFASI